MKLLIIDDDPIVCQSLKMIIEASANDTFTVLATGQNGKEAIALFRKHRPDLILMDIRMEEMDGITAGKTIKEEDPNIRILYLTTFPDEEYIASALQLGAAGYLMKSDVTRLMPALHAIAGGNRVFGEEIVEKIPAMMDKPKKAVPLKELTEKENQLVELVAQGKNNREIAQELFLSEGTIRNYLSTILGKLNLRDRTQLVVYYYKHQR